MSLLPLSCPILSFAAVARSTGPTQSEVRYDRDRKNPDRIEEKGRKGETQSEVRNDRDRKNPERIEGKEWERRNPERIKGKGEKGEPPRGGRKEQ